MSLKVLITIFMSTVFLSVPAFSKSKKKEAADAAAISMSPPQVLETSDTIVGLRTGMGELDDGGSGVGLHIERQITEFVSLSGEYYYSSYSQNFQNFGEFKYTSNIFVAFASLHADILKIKNLDTSLNIGAAHNQLSAKWNSQFDLPNPGTATASSTNLVLFLNARYFFNSHWAGSFSVGKNLNTILLGVDYLF